MGVCPYDILGIDPSDRRRLTRAQLARQYRKLALLHHPDRCNGSAEEFIRINAAYNELLDDLQEPAEDPWWSRWLWELYPGGVAEIHEEVHRSPERVFVRLAKRVPLQTEWDQDIHIRIRIDSSRLGKQYLVKYQALRHRVEGSVIVFDEVTESHHVIFPATIDYANEFLTLAGHGNDVIDPTTRTLVRGDVLVDVDIV